jgi:FkbM family methyltransferase
MHNLKLKTLRCLNYLFVNFYRLLTPPLLLSCARYLRLRLKTYHGQWKIDKKIAEYLNYDNGYYVELGAVDGIGLSNTLHFELHRNWSGLLIEPAPNNYLKCLANRGKKNVVVCNACTSFEYKDKFVEMIYAHYMSTPVGLESDVIDPDAHAQSGSKLLASETERVYRFGAIAKPLNTLLLEANAPNKIDFLSLDVEGAEIDVLKGIDHERFRFKLMCIESRDKDKITEYLSQHGYHYAEQISPLDHIYLAND